MRGVRVALALVLIALVVGSCVASAAAPNKSKGSNKKKAPSGHVLAERLHRLKSATLRAALSESGALARRAMESKTTWSRLIAFTPGAKKLRHKARRRRAANVRRWVSGINRLAASFGHMRVFTSRTLLAVALARGNPLRYSGRVRRAFRIALKRADRVVLRLRALSIQQGRRRANYARLLRSDKSALFRADRSAFAANQRSAKGLSSKRRRWDDCVVDLLTHLHNLRDARRRYMAKYGSLSRLGANARKDVVQRKKSQVRAARVSLVRIYKNYKKVSAKCFARRAKFLGARGAFIAGVAGRRNARRRAHKNAYRAEDLALRRLRSTTESLRRLRRTVRGGHRTLRRQWAQIAKLL